MGTDEGGGQNCLEGWEQVREGSEPSGGMGTGEGGVRTVWGDGNR
jgi:hypothetical protein